MLYLKTMKKLKLVILIVLFIAVLSTAGVYAVWMYADDVDKEDAMVGIHMGTWDPVIVLPDNEEGIAGTDHTVMIEEILNNSNAGINPKPRVLLNAIKDEKKNPFAEEGIFYSDQDKVTGGNLKFLFETNIEKIDFILQSVVDDLRYYVYTFLSPDEGEIGGNERVYKTLLEKKNGEWQATQAQIGRAPIIDRTAGGITICTIDYTNWISE